MGTGVGGGGGAAPCVVLAPLERRLWLCPASCQVVAALDVAAAALPAAAAGVVVAALRFAAAVVDAAGAAVAAPGRVGAGSPRDSASLRQRVLITPSRDAIWRWSEAIIACSAVGGGGGGWAGSLPPLRPLERERPRAAPSSMVVGGAPARKGASAAPMAIRTAGRCRRAANWVATPAWSPIVCWARGRRRGKTRVRQKKKRRKLWLS